MKHQCPSPFINNLFVGILKLQEILLKDILTLLDCVGGGIKHIILKPIFYFKLCFHAQFNLFVTRFYLSSLNNSIKEPNHITNWIFTTIHIQSHKIPVYSVILAADMPSH